MATALKIIKRSLRLIKVKEANEPISAEEGEDALDVLNNILDSYTNEDLMQFFRPERVVALVSGQKLYTIGAGGDINVPRPVSIENAFSRDSGDSDWPITQLNNDDYQKIILKDTVATYPIWFFYRPNFPLGEISLWPVPGPNLDLHINVRSELDTFTTIDTDLNFPPGYQRLLEYQLAIEIAPEYRNANLGDIEKLAIQAKADIEQTNNKNVPILTSELVPQNMDLGNAWFSGGASE